MNELRLATKRGPGGPLRSSDLLGSLDAHDGGGRGEAETHDQQEGWRKTVEETFEFRERHDTHLLV